MAITSLSTQYISASFINLTQISSSGELFNGAGVPVTVLKIDSITGSFNGTASTASYYQESDPIFVSVSASFATTASLNSFTSSYILDSSSFSNRITNSEASITSLNAVTNSFATLLSNTFTGDQTINGSLTISQNLTVLGSSSIRYITSSQLNIGDNIITVNTINPSIRFGGLAVVDSGSLPQTSGSLLFDSQNNQWIFVHQSDGAFVTSSVLIMGPQTFDNVGNETTLTTNRLTKAAGGDLGEHIGDSNITDTGTLVSINSNSVITGSLIVTQGITGSLYGTASYALNAGGDSSTPGGVDKQIQFNSGSTFSGQSALTYDYTSRGFQQGFQTTASGQYSHAEGILTITIGSGSHAEGRGNIAWGDRNHVGGNLSLAGAKMHYFKNVGGIYYNASTRKMNVCGNLTGSFSDGSTIYWGHSDNLATYKSVVSGSVEFVPGDFTFSYSRITYPGYSVISIYEDPTGGVNDTWLYEYGFVAVPNPATSEYDKTNNISFGQNTVAEGKESAAFGLYNVSRNQAGFSHGVFNIAEGQFAHAEGQDTVANGQGAHSEGTWTDTVGNWSHAEGVGSTSYGNYSHAEGANTIATGSASHTEGYYTKTIGDYSHAEGYRTLAINTGSHAEGYFATTSGSYSHAEGYYTIASGSYSHAEGRFSKSIGLSSHAEGTVSISSGDYSHAEGAYTTAIGDSSHAEGSRSIASGIGSHAEGTGSLASGSYSHAEGYFTITSASGAHAEGGYTIASGLYSHAEGQYTIALGVYSHAEGRFTNSYKAGSHAEGYYTTTSGSFSHAEGGFAIAEGNWSHAEGSGSYTSGSYSHAEGGTTTTLGDYSHAEGISTTTYATALYAHAEGDSTSVEGEGAHAEGYMSIAIGICSHAEGGYKANVLAGGTAIGAGSHAEGVGTSANGVGSHTEGSNTTTNANYSHAEGATTTTEAEASHAEGALTIALGVGSHAEGLSTITTGSYSHAEGIGTRAYEDYQLAIGKWNNTSNANQLFIIGKGSAEGSRSNALRVSSNGNLNIAGTLTQSSADYAEYFESLDGTAIPNGTVVELENGKIKVCVTASNAIGVISSRPGVLGNSDEGTSDEWVDKYQKDVWGNFILEDYEEEIIIIVDGKQTIETKPSKRLKLNPLFNPNIEYIPREQRPEWNKVGLLGQIRVLKNQQIPSTWIKLKDINSEIAMYLVK